MASNGNFSTWNPLLKPPSGLTLSQGNLKATLTSNNTGIMTNWQVPLTGKWYWEVDMDNIPSGQGVYIGVMPANTDLTINQESNNLGLVYYSINGNSILKGTRSSYGATYTTGDIISIAVDRDANTLQFYKNNSGQGTISISTLDEEFFCYMGCTGGSGPFRTILNFGQDSTFGGNETAGGNADENGFGDFKYAPVSGHLALCSGNLPISADIDPAGDDGETENPTKQFGVVTYTGNSPTGQAITGLGFQPDLVWAKMRSSSQSNFLSDTSRGINKFLFSDQTAAEGSGGGYATVYNSFDSDGFTFGTSGSGPNDSGRTYVAWCWRANGGVTSSNTDGASTTTVQANTKAGFSIVQCPNYTSNSTFGHGLDSAPEFITVKLLASGSRWATYHTGLTSAGHYLSLNTNDAQATGSFFNSTAPTSSVFSLGASFGGSGASIAYCWHSVEGYSKFGSYEGNGNNDGPFIYTGFRPRYWFFKEIDAADDWVAYDTARDTANTGSSKVLRYDSSTSEFDDSGRAVDVLSNGLKIRTFNNTINVSGNTYIYGAWGDVPFKYNNTF